MNVKRFVGKNTREAMAQVRAAYGDEAVLLSNRAVPGGVEILAMPSADVPNHRTPARSSEPVAAEPEAAMSTLSFQEFVRERARKRAAEVAAEPLPAQAADSGTKSLPRSVAMSPESSASMTAVSARVGPKTALTKPYVPSEPARYAASRTSSAHAGCPSRRRFSVAGGGRRIHGLNSRGKGRPGSESIAPGTGVTKQRRKSAVVIAGISLRRAGQPGASRRRPACAGRAARRPGSGRSRCRRPF